MFVYNDSRTGTILWHLVTELYAIGALFVMLYEQSGLHLLKHPLIVVILNNSF
jgi:hypothetical protein